MKTPYGMTIMEKTAFPHGCGPGRERAGGGRASMPRLAVGEGVLGAQTPVYFQSPQLPRIHLFPPLPSREKACLVWEDGQNEVHGQVPVHRHQDQREEDHKDKEPAGQCIRPHHSGLGADDDRLGSKATARGGGDWDQAMEQSGVTDTTQAWSPTARPGRPSCPAGRGLSPELPQRGAPGSVQCSTSWSAR